MIDQGLLAKWAEEDKAKRRRLKADAIEATGISVGTTVRRKSGKQCEGVVERIYVRPNRNNTADQVTADVHSAKAVRRLNGNRDMRSAVGLNSLVKVG
jgi:hypothetical protein